jgi:hypothetical protein
VILLFATRIDLFGGCKQESFDFRIKKAWWLKTESLSANAEGAEGYPRLVPIVDLLSACCQVSMAHLLRKPSRFIRVRALRGDSNANQNASSR